MREVKRHITVLRSYTSKGEFLLVIIKNSNKKGLFLADITFITKHYTFYLEILKASSAILKMNPNNFKCKNMVVSWFMHSSGKIQGVDRLSGVKAMGD